MSFANFDLDERLLKAIAEIGWEKPTQVQSSMIPLALDDKNILARARTGSGKTAAFLLPIIQKILQLSAMSSKSKTKALAKGPHALIIAPTKELAQQIHTLLTQLTVALPFVQTANLALAEEAPAGLADEPLDVVVTTPGRLLEFMRRAANHADSALLAAVRYVVLDEADLLFSYGYRDDITKIKAALPSRYQTIMTSATLDEDLSELKAMFVVGQVYSLKLKEGKLPNASQLSQYHVFCQGDEERFTILLSLLKLKLLVGKSVIFVSTVDRCYKLSLFLDAFKISSCILNAQMPANYRCHVIHEFNNGKFPFIIASENNDIFDESEDVDPDTQKQNKAKWKKEKKKRHIDKESGIGRGIDFNHVSNVINFDFPTSTDMYIHRVGRTARGWNKGTAISLVGQSERRIFETIQHEVNKQMGYVALQPYEVNMKDFESFQLRAREVISACTKTVVREARLAEIRREILRSRQLEAYFKKNPREKEALENDKKKCRVNVYSAGIADVPDYMVPKALRGQNFGEEKKAGAGSKRMWKRKHGEVMTAKQKRFKKQSRDPLNNL